MSKLFTLCLVVIAAILMGSGPAEAAPRYNITALDKLPGTLDSLAFGLNDVGQVVGDSRFDRSGHIGQSRPVTWDASSGPSDFIIPVELWADSQVGGSAADINNHGVVVGRYGSGAGILLPTPRVPCGRGFVWDSVNGRRDLGLEPLGNSQAVAINDAGQVVGTSEVLTTVDIEGEPQNLFIPRAFIWDGTIGIRDLGDLGGFGAFANDINSLGQVVGYADNAAGGERAFIWDSVNGIQELPTLSGASSRATAINDAGLVVGGEFGFGGFLWDATNGIRTIPIGGNDINNFGQVVGGPVGDVAIWDEMNGVQRLIELIPNNTGWQLETALAINDAGEIVGFGQLNGEVRGFLLTPVPEPSSVILAILTLLTAVSCYRTFSA